MIKTEINLQKYFKIDIPLKNHIVFESEVNQRGLQYKKIKETQITSSISYFILKTDFEIIDKILIENHIVANTNDGNYNDFRDTRKFIKICLLIAILIITIILLFFIVERFLY
ncbi:hypothetical protein [Patiriisocius hiemis]|uniref:Uncharacterized protein n=1 Tax=Patiriisocius hiemis TaxID=3075604 RepID=A0ABU2YF09_9FLAO|nr:hypothetical protein [Constantimarinum sp. W242]MDT0556756.1 hypothetical protein [Constantimarinum sp. W242]